MMYSWLVLGLADMLRWALLWMAFGSAMSATLHSCTIVGDLRTAASVDCKGLMALVSGGFCDRLLSNHTYNAGLAMLAAEFQWGLPAFAAPLFSVVFGLVVAATRTHYTVDVVLAWWVLGGVRALAVVAC